MGSNEKDGLPTKDKLVSGNFVMAGLKHTHSSSLRHTRRRRKGRWATELRYQHGQQERKSPHRIMLVRRHNFARWRCFGHILHSKGVTGGSGGLRLGYMGANLPWYERVSSPRGMARAVSKQGGHQNEPAQAGLLHLELGAGADQRPTEAFGQPWAQVLPTMTLRPSAGRAQEEIDPQAVLLAEEAAGMTNCAEPTLKRVSRIVIVGAGNGRAESPIIGRLDVLGLRQAHASNQCLPPRLRRSGEEKS